MKSSAWSGLLEPENLMGLEQIFNLERMDPTNPNKSEPEKFRISQTWSPKLLEKVLFSAYFGSKPVKPKNLMGFEQIVKPEPVKNCQDPFKPIV